MAASPTTAETKSPAAGLLIYDGDCGFCTSAARKFVDFADNPDLVASWQSLDLDELGLTEAQVSSAAYWIRDGKHHAGADAVARALQGCGGIWTVVGTIMSVPPIIWLARAIYPLVAKYRYRLPGSTDACRI